MSFVLCVVMEKVALSLFVFLYIFFINWLVSILGENVSDFNRKNKARINMFTDSHQKVIIL